MKKFAKAVHLLLILTLAASVLSFAAIGVSAAETTERVWQENLTSYDGSSLPSAFTWAGTNAITLDTDSDTGRNMFKVVSSGVLKTLKAALPTNITFESGKKYEITYDFKYDADLTDWEQSTKTNIFGLSFTDGTNLDIMRIFWSSPRIHPALGDSAAAYGTYVSQQPTAGVSHTMKYVIDLTGDTGTVTYYMDGVQLTNAAEGGSSTYNLSSTYAAKTLSGLRWQLRSSAQEGHTEDALYLGNFSIDVVSTAADPEPEPEPTGHIYYEDLTSYDGSALPSAFAWGGTNAITLHTDSDTGRNMFRVNTYNGSGADLSNLDVALPTAVTLEKGKKYEITYDFKYDMDSAVWSGSKTAIFDLNFSDGNTLEIMRILWNSPFIHPLLGDAGEVTYASRVAQQPAADVSHTMKYVIDLTGDTGTVTYYMDGEQLTNEKEEDPSTYNLPSKYVGATLTGLRWKLRTTTNSGHTGDGLYLGNFIIDDITPAAEEPIADPSTYVYEENFNSFTDGVPTGWTAQDGLTVTQGNNSVLLQYHQTADWDTKKLEMPTSGAIYEKYLELENNKYEISYDVKFNQNTSGTLSGTLHQAVPTFAKGIMVSPAIQILNGEVTVGKNIVDNGNYWYISEKTGTVATISADTWYNFKMEITADENNGYVKYYMDGNLIASADLTDNHLVSEYLSTLNAHVITGIRFNSRTSSSGDDTWEIRNLKIKQTARLFSYSDDMTSWTAGEGVTASANADGSITLGGSGRLSKGLANKSVEMTVDNPYTVETTVSASAASGVKLCLVPESGDEITLDYGSVPAGDHTLKSVVTVTQSGAVVKNYIDDALTGTEVTISSITDTAQISAFKYYIDIPTGESVVLSSLNITGGVTVESLSAAKSDTAVDVTAVIVNKNSDGLTPYIIAAVYSGDTMVAAKAADTAALAGGKNNISISIPTADACDSVKLFVFNNLSEIVPLGKNGSGTVAAQ